MCTTPITSSPSPSKTNPKKNSLQAYMEVNVWLPTRGYCPLLHKLDNKTSHNVEAFIAVEQIKIQNTPPDMHCTNPAKRVVRM
jgi:hypothetical protein